MMRTSLLILVPLCGLLVGIDACAPREEPVPQGLSETYAELLRYRSKSRSLDSTAYAEGVDSLLGVHGYTRESFAEEFRKVGSSAGQVTSFFDSATVRLLPPGRR